MSIEEAFEELTKSEGFKALCKGTDSTAGKYRMYLSRYRKDNLKVGAMVEILLLNGYEVKANKVTKKTPSSK